MRNALTIDVEEWFHVSRFRNVIKPGDWPELESRVVQNVCYLLKLLREHEVRATFFVLGWIAERRPELVYTIAQCGHEIGSHSYAHQLVYEQTREEFTEDLQKSLHVLRGVVGSEVKCYRAPSYSISSRNLWVFETLHDNGITIDSSLFPIKHDLYGVSDSPTGIFEVSLNGKGSLIECPLSTVSVAGKNFPVAGGGYLRLFPLWVISKGIARLNRAEQPAIIYVHPWELDPLQPRIAVSFFDRVRHYANLETTAGKLRTLLRTFPFSTLGEIVVSHKPPGKRPILTLESTYEPNQQP